jgi:hypothetical protein
MGGSSYPVVAPGGFRMAGEVNQTATLLETPTPSQVRSRSREDRLLDTGAPVPLSARTYQRKDVP